MDSVAKKRSARLERAAPVNFARLATEERDRRDIEIIDRNADRLNREAADTFKYRQLL